MRPPIAFISGNCVFAAGLHDPWAAFEVELSSYAWLTEDGKRRRFLALLGAIEAVEADIQLLRVSGRWDPGEYLGDVARELAGPREAGLRYARQQASRLGDLAAVRPRLFLLVSLRQPQRDVASFLSGLLSAGPASWRASIAAALDARGRRFLSAHELERVHCEAEQVELRLADFLAVRQPGSSDLQWLVRRAFCRGLGEPGIDRLHSPRALAFERNGEAVLAPLEADLTRWGSLVPLRWFLSSA